MHESHFRLTVTQNSAPYVSTDLSTDTPTTNQVLTVSTESSDIDGDPIQRRFVWKVDGTTVADSGLTDDTTSAIDLSVPGRADADAEIVLEVSAFDGELWSAVDRSSATVVSSPPLVSTPSARSVDPGDTVAINGSAIDPDGDALAGAEVDYGDGTPVQPVSLAGDGSFALSHPYAAVGTYLLVVSVTDAGGKRGRGTTVVAVVGPNAAPSIDPIVGATLVEGAMFTRSGVFRDPGDIESHTATVDYGDGAGPVPLSLSGSTFTLSHRYRDNGSFTVTVSVTDTGGLIGIRTLTVVVTNAVPTVQPPVASSDPLSGSPMTVSAAFADVGTLDTHTASVSWGDGGPTTQGVVTESAGSGAVNASHTYGAGGDFTITVTVTDDDGGSTSSAVQVTVGQGHVNEPPSVQLPSAGPLSEGGTYTATGTWSDPETDPSTATVDYGDGSGVHPLTLDDGSFQLEHLYADEGSYLVAVQVIDDHGAVGAEDMLVMVANEDPVVNDVVGPTTTVAYGSQVTVTSSFADPGIEDTHTVSYDWGDGTVEDGVVSEAYGQGATSGHHVYSGDGQFTVQVTVSDGDQGSGSSSTTFTVAANRAPTVAVPHVDTIDEGSTYTASGTWSDPESDPTTATVDYGDGDGEQPLTLAAGGGFELSHDYADDGDYFITVQVTDDHGGIGSDTSEQRVRNAAPVIGAVTGPGGQVAIGREVTVTSSFSDAGVNDLHTVAYDWGDGTFDAGTLNEGEGSTTGAHTYASEGSYTVTVTVDDSDGGSGSGTTTVEVAANGSPTVAIDHGATIDEGDTYTSSGAWSDPEDNAVTATVDYGDGTGEQQLDLAAGTFDLSHQYGEDGNFDVTVTVTDDRLATGSTTRTVHVYNVAPDVSDVTGPAGSSAFGDVVEVTASFSDVGVQDTHTVTYDWGDAVTEAGSVSEAGIGSGTTSGSHTYQRDGSFTITVTVTDDDGGSSSAHTEVTIANSVPVVEIAHGDSIVEGSSYSSPGTWVDADGDAATATVDYGDGSGSHPLDLGDGTFGLDHTYVDDGSFTVEVELTDDDGATAVDSRTVVVINGDPTIETVTGPVDPVPAGDGVTVTSTFSDPGGLDTHTVFYDWGDGAAEVGDVDESGGNGSTSATHDYADGGVYTVMLMVTDDDGGTAFASTLVTVLAPPPNGGPVVTMTDAASVAEGSAYSSSGAWSDPEGDPVTATVDYGDGGGEQPLTLGSGTFQLSHTYADDGTYLVTVSATDDTDGVGSDSRTVVVSNADPVVSSVTGPSGSVVKDTQVTVTSAFHDPGVLDSHTATYDWGDGDSTTGAVTESGGAGTSSASHAFANAGTYTVTVTADDGQGGTGSKSATVTVTAPSVNGAPTLTVAPPASVVEGSAIHTTGTYADPEGDPVTGTVDYGGGPQALSLSAGTFSLDHTYADNGSKVVTVAISDDHAHTTTTTVTVVVTNAPPVLATLTGPTTPGLTTTPVTVAGAFTDAGTTDTHTVTYAWGDGTTSSGLVTETPRKVSATHTYTAGGSFTVSVTLTDDDGASATRTFGPVQVAAPAKLLGDGSGKFKSPKKSSRLAKTKKGTATFAFSAGTRPVTGTLQRTPYGSASLTFKKGKIAFTGTSVSAAASTPGSHVVTATVTGTNKGKAGYTLVLTAVDGSPDRVRFRLLKGSKVVYDSQPGAAATAAPKTKVVGRVTVY